MPSGRVKGTPNKLTASVKDSILKTFDALGGVESLVAWARRNPHEFYTLWGKLLPRELELAGKDGGAIQVQEVSDLEAARRIAFLLTKGAAAAADAVH